MLTLQKYYKFIKCPHSRCPVDPPNVCVTFYPLPCIFSKNNAMMTRETPQNCEKSCANKKPEYVLPDADRLVVDK